MLSCTGTKERLSLAAPHPWFYSSEDWFRWGWKCPRMALCWFSLVLVPSVAVKQSAIEFVHSGRTLNRKEGSGHSFWSYCLTTRLKQSNSSGQSWVLTSLSVFFFPWWALGEEAGIDGKWLFMGFHLFLLVWWHLFMACLQVFIFLQQSRKGKSESWECSYFGNGVKVCIRLSLQVYCKQRSKKKLFHW